MARAFTSSEHQESLCGDCFDQNACDIANAQGQDAQDAYVESFVPIGESDGPEHCDACGQFLENSLTDVGMAYVKARCANIESEPIGSTVRADLSAWMRCYGLYECVVCDNMRHECEDTCCDMCARHHGTVA